MTRADDEDRENFQHAERKITAGKSKVTLSQLNLLKRMYYAHENGMENLPIFYIAVVRPLFLLWLDSADEDQAAALIAHLPAKEANALGAFYIGSRLVYNACYILISEFAFSPVRPRLLTLRLTRLTRSRSARPSTGSACSPASP